jgi:hypothetical protein
MTTQAHGFEQHAHRDFLAIVGLLSAGLCNIGYFLVFALV